MEDLPGHWNRKYQNYLGITPTNDADGILQDIHWSFGEFGYFLPMPSGLPYRRRYFQDEGSHARGRIPEGGKYYSNPGVPKGQHP